MIEKFAKKIYLTNRLLHYKINAYLNDYQTSADIS